MWPRTPPLLMAPDVSTWEPLGEGSSDRMPESRFIAESKQHNELKTGG